jgi:hypothetical protein
MKQKDIMTGMKVVPFQKTAGGNPFPTYDWDMRAKRQGYLYVIEWNDEKRCWILHSDGNSDSGDWYNAEDFNPYEEKLEATTQKQEKFWIVADNNFPTRVTYKHTTENMARLEAQRLAKEHPKFKFVVLEAIYAVEVNALVETEYEQDLDIPF